MALQLPAVAAVRDLVMDGFRAVALLLLVVALIRVATQAALAADHELGKELLLLRASVRGRV